MERSRSKTSADLLIADWSRQRSPPARLFGSLRARAHPRELATVRHDPRGPAARMFKARPLILEEDSFVANWGRRRLDLRPGITGTWQVSGRTEIRFEEMVRLDYLYATSWSPWNDVRLILRTPPTVVWGGAG
jgi:hypothetical protein